MDLRRIKELLVYQELTTREIYLHVAVGEYGLGVTSLERGSFEKLKR